MACIKRKELDAKVNIKAIVTQAIIYKRRYLFYKLKALWWIFIAKYRFVVFLIMFYCLLLTKLKTKPNLHIVVMGITLSKVGH